MNRVSLRKLFDHVEANEYVAECSVLNVELDIGSVRVAAVGSHGKSEKHTRLI